MFWFQELARQHTKKPVLMSSLVQLPSVTAAFAHHEQIAVFTANSRTLEPMHDLIARTCGVRVEDERFVIVGCQDVPGFEAVELGGKVNTKKVQPGIVNLAKRVIADHPGAPAAPLLVSERNNRSAAQSFRQAPCRRQHHLPSESHTLRAP